MKTLDNKTIYRCYTILGKTEKESEKLYVKEQWMEFCKLLDRFVKQHQLLCCLVSYQLKIVVKKIDKKGRMHITAKNVPTGGIQKWTEKAHLKVCKGQLEEHLKLLEKLETDGISMNKYIENNFPEANSYFNFIETLIYAYLDQDVNIKHQPQGDIHIYLRNSLDPSNKTWDQELNFYISDRLIEISGIETVEKLINNIAKIAKAVVVAKADFIESKIINIYGMQSITAVYGRRYGQHNSLNLNEYSDLQINKWELL